MVLKEFKLTIDLIPSPLWYKSIYSFLRSYGLLDKWERIKKGVFRKEGYKCFICDNREGLELHEFFDYDDTDNIQKLVGIHHICSLCHKVKHIGFWCYTDKGLNRLEQLCLSREDLINHFCSVNSCSREVFEKYEKEVFDLFNERSKKDWIQDFSLIYGVYV